MPAPQQLIVLLFMAVPDLLVICYMPVNTTVNYQLPITNYQLPITNYQLPITNYQLPITNYQLPITNYQLPITNYQLPITQKICPGADVGESLSLYFMKKCNLH